MAIVGKVPDQASQDADKVTTESASPEPSQELREDADNRALYQPDTRYSKKHRDSQFCECIYVVGLLVVALITLALAGLGILDRALHAIEIPIATIANAHKYELFFAGGLLGGTVYGAKWLYHAIAKGLWNEDRRPWRYMSPWIAVGTTIGICTLLDAGFFIGATDQFTPTTSAGCAGLGFLVGYLADSFLAKMKEVTRVIFGEAESHPNRRQDSDDGLK